MESFIEVIEQGLVKTSDKVMVTNADGTTRPARYYTLRVSYAPIADNGAEYDEVTDILNVWERTGRSVDVLNYNKLFDAANAGKCVGKRKAGCIVRRAVAPWTFTNSEGQVVTATTKQLVITFSSGDPEEQALAIDRAFARFEASCVKNGSAVVTV